MGGIGKKREEKLCSVSKIYQKIIKKIFLTAPWSPGDSGKGRNVCVREVINNRPVFFFHFPTKLNRRSKVIQRNFKE